jgi:Ca2+-binding EF-hand superfamily protein
VIRERVSLYGSREDMTKAFNAVDTDGDGLVDKDSLATLLGMIKYDTSEEAVAAQFAAADVQSKGVVTYEQWCKAFLDASKPPEPEKKFFGLF